MPEKAAQRALERWREAERLLAEITAGTDEWAAAKELVEARRREYAEAFELVLRHRQTIDPDPSPIVDGSSGRPH